MKISAKAGTQLLDVTIERVDGRYVVEVDGKRHEVDSHKLEGDFYTILTGGRSYEVSVRREGDGYRVYHGAAGQTVTITDPSRRARDARAGADGPENVVSLMPGKIVRVLVAEGDAVEPGQGLLVVEAMKMENEIASEKGGKVTRVAVAPGDTVEGGSLLAVVE